MKLKIFTDYEKTSTALAEEIMELLSLKLNSNICLAAGDTPKGLFKVLRERATNTDTFSQCEFFGLDEWVGLGRKDKGSCKNLVYSELLEPLNISEERIHFFDALSENLEQECSKIDSLIDEKGGLDIVVLGIGMNGHVGFNEPGARLESGSHVIELDEVTKTVGQKYFSKKTKLSHGITLGLKQLLSSKHVFLLVCGKNKSPIVKRTLEEAISLEVPASNLRLNEDLTVYLDEAAATLLNN